MAPCRGPRVGFKDVDRVPGSVCRAKAHARNTCSSGGGRMGLSAPAAATAELGCCGGRPSPTSAPLRPANLGNGRDDHARQQAAADDMVLGGVFDGNALQRHLGSATPEPARPRLVSNGLDVVRQAARAMVNREREPLRVSKLRRRPLGPHKDDPIVATGGPQRGWQDAGRRRGEIDGGGTQRARLKITKASASGEKRFSARRVAAQTRQVTDDGPSTRALRHQAQGDHGG